MSPNFALEDRRPPAPRPERLRIRIDLDPVGQPPSDPPAPARRKLKAFNFQNISIPYGDYGRGKKRYWMLFWYEGTKRVQETRRSYKALEKRAEQIAISIRNGQTAMLRFKEDDRASYQRALELIRPTGKSLELVAAEYAEIVQILAGRAAPVDAIRDYIVRLPADQVRKKIPDIVTELFEKRDLCSKWQRNLKTMLDRFAAQFAAEPQQLQGRDITDWLSGLKGKKEKKVGARSRHNHRSAIVNLFSFAKERGYVAADWDIMKEVPFAEPPPSDINIYTPDELVKLLATAENYVNKRGRRTYADLIPFIAITAFAGVRHGEMNEEKIHHLDWSNVRFKTKRIIIPENVAKRTTRRTGNARVADMPDNLVAWLKTYARPSGKICDRRNTGSALCKLRELAGINGRKNNALRKSFISYQKALTGNIDRVADVAGNSVAMIRRNYLHVDEEMREDAERWFSIMPTSADVLPLFAWQNRK